MRSPASAKQIDRRTLIRLGEIVLEADHPHRIVRRQVCAGPIARDDPSRHRHLNHPATASARRENIRARSACWVHGGATDVGDPSGRFGIGQLDEPRGDVAGVDGLEPHPTQGPQHGREALDREDRFDQLVELGGTRHGVADAGGFQRAFDAQLGLVVGRRMRSMPTIDTCTM